LTGHQEEGKLIMKMISYAYNHEDVLLSRVFAGQSQGSYIDVGASHPRYGSLSCHFYERGWSGVNVEPIPELFGAFPSERSRDVNLNVGLSDQAGQRPFYQVVGEEGLSTFVAAQAEEYRAQGRTIRERTVPVLTLADVCARHVPGPIDFLSIDVEGHERAVLAGGDWRRWRPRVVVVEATRPWSTVPTHHLWEDILLAADYRFGAFDGNNRYYVRAEDADLLPRLAVPVNIFDAYEPYHYVRRIADLEGALAQTREQLRQAEDAARLLNAQLQSLQRLPPPAGMGRRITRRTGHALRQAFRALRGLVAKSIRR
jgi:FkbM family methyltransferase